MGEPEPARRRPRGPARPRARGRGGRARRPRPARRARRGSPGRSTARARRRPPAARAGPSGSRSRRRDEHVVDGGRRVGLGEQGSSRSPRVAGEAGVLHEEERVAVGAGAQRGGLGRRWAGRSGHGRDDRPSRRRWQPGQVEPQRVPSGEPLGDARPGARSGRVVAPGRAPPSSRPGCDAPRAAGRAPAGWRCPTSAGRRGRTSTVGLRGRAVHQVARCRPRRGTGAVAVRPAPASVGRRPTEARRARCAHGPQRRGALVLGAAADQHRRSPRSPGERRPARRTAGSCRSRARRRPRRRSAVPSPASSSRATRAASSSSRPTIGHGAPGSGRGAGEPPVASRDGLRTAPRVAPGAVERGVLAQHGGLHVAQLGARARGRARRRAASRTCRSTSRASACRPDRVERERAERPQPLAQGVLRGERLQLARPRCACRPSPAPPPPGPPSASSRSSSSRARSACGGGGVLELGVGDAAPQRERLVERGEQLLELGGASGPVRRRRAPPRSSRAAGASCRRRVEAGGVERLRRDAQGVAGRSVTSTVAGVRAARSGSSARRRPATYPCRVRAPLGGGASAQSRSTRVSAGTGRPRCSASPASRARCLRVPRSTAAPSRRASAAPSTDTWTLAGTRAG